MESNQWPTNEKNAVAAPGTGTLDGNPKGASFLSIAIVNNLPHVFSWNKNHICKPMLPTLESKEANTSGGLEITQLCKD
jgi:hypothetical protein